MMISCLIIFSLTSETYAQNNNSDVFKIKIIGDEKKDNPFEFFQHPLVILLAGAIISGVLIPFFTKNWQNHQKSLDIKNDLVTEISKTVTTMMINVQYFLENTKKRSDGEQIEEQQKYNDNYKNWTIAKDIITSRLEAYFPTQNITQQWKKYTAVINDVYALSTINEKSKRKDKINKIKKYLNTSKSETMTDQINWDMLEDRENAIKDGEIFTEEYLDNWWNLKKSILDAENVIIQDIIKKPIQGFGKKWLSKT